MNATRTACILSGGIMLAATMPAFAQSPEPRGARSFRDRHPQSAVVQQRQFRPAARDTRVRRPVFVEPRVFVRRPGARQVVVAPPVYMQPPFVVYDRPVFDRRPGVRQVVVGPPVYIQPPFVVYDRPAYYSEPAYYVGALAAAAYPPPPPPYYSAPAYYADAAPARAEPAYPPPPPPVVKPVPAPKRFTLSADALFDFDRAIVKPEGRRQLDKLAADLKRAKFDVINIAMVTVTGHTDRFGSAAYNMRLSMRRAEAVKAYLVELGIPAAKIVATGKGETHPVTKPGECKGDKATKELKVCLQPDRRVEIEVSGAK